MLEDTLVPPAQAMTWSQSVLSQLWILMTLLTVPNEDDIILFLFLELLRICF
jgi:hypothetical protein